MNNPNFIQLSLNLNTTDNLNSYQADNFQASKVHYLKNGHNFKINDCPNSELANKDSDLNKYFNEWNWYNCRQCH